MSEGRPKRCTDGVQNGELDDLLLTERIRKPQLDQQLTMSWWAPRSVPSRKSQELLLGHGFMRVSGGGDSNCAKYLTPTVRTASIGQFQSFKTSTHRRHSS